MALNDPNDKVYNTRALSKWFAIGSLVLLLAVVWAVLEDYDRDWKRYSRQSQKIAAAVGERKLHQAEQLMDQSKLEGIEKKIQENQLATQKFEKELKDKIAHRAALYYRANQDFQFKKAKLDAELFHLEHAIKAQDPKVPNIRAHYQGLEAEVKALKVKADEAERNRDAARGDEAQLLSQQKALKDELLALNLERERIKKVIAQNEMSLFNIVRNSPVVDFIAPTVKISQVVTPHLKDDYFFNKVPRVDRCMSCHVTIASSGFEDFPQPFKSHPKLNRYVGPDSPHPQEKFGCTACHAGAGNSVDFTLSAHTPRSPEQAAEWEAKYHYHSSPHIGTPMIPTPMTEGKCVQCHAKQVELEDAPVFNAGMRNIEKYGCWGCHKFAGHFEELSKVKKVGPPLRTITSKVNETWIQKWLWDPKSFRPSTTMPSFWKLHNNSDPASLDRAAVEIEAITAYLAKKSVPFEPLKMASQAMGDAAKGKELVGSIGCLGCHAVADFPRKNPPAGTLGHLDPRVPMFGPELNQLGSKVSKEWLYSWLINPKHYSADTAMPNMKLSSTEANDIAEYLLTKRNVNFENIVAPTPQDKARDKAMVTYLEAAMSPKEAAVKLASMSLDDKKMFLGEKLIGHYGCYGCHAISGFEKFPKLGAELSYEGSKDVSKFAFENTDLDRNSRAQWIYTKIRTPRIWDVGKNRDFESKTRMPQFGFSAEQTSVITAIVLGHENKNVDDEMIFKVNGRWESIIRGQEIIQQKNCIGCHALENRGAEILAHYQDDVSAGPPNLNTEGKKVQTDWLYRFLANPTVMIRPWVKARMPQYHLDREQLTDLTKYFAAYDKASYPYSDKAERMTDADRKAAEELVAKQGCMTCHAVRAAGQPVEDAAPHFANVKGRLRAPWVITWIRNPQAIMPGTRMPSLWPAVDEGNPNSPHAAVPGYFGDDAERQLRAVRNWLYQFGGAPLLPPLREDLEEPVMSSSGPLSPSTSAKQ